MIPRCPSTPHPQRLGMIEMVASSGWERSPHGGRVVKVTAVTCFCARIFHAAGTAVVKVHFVLGNEAHCLLHAAGAPTFAKDSSILTGHDRVSVLPCSVVLTGGRHGLDVVGCSDGVALVELGVHVQVSTWLETTLQGKDSESEHIASPLASTGLTRTGALSLHISCCLLISGNGVGGQEEPYASP